jgi:hypothetical protein
VEACQDENLWKEICMLYGSLPPSLADQPSAENIDLYSLPFFSHLLVLAKEYEPLVGEPVTQLSKMMGSEFD